MTHLRTLSIGGATYDLFVRTGKGLDFKAGDKIRVDQVVETCGGGASNTAVGLARLGCTSHFCGILGSDQWGERMFKNFKEENVDASAATVVEGETSSFSIILSATSGERVILYDPGTNAHLHDANFDREKVAGMDWMYLNHIHERSCMIENDIIAILEKCPTMGLTWNPGGTQLKKGITDPGNLALLRHSRLLLCNKEEALEFTGTRSTEDAITALLGCGVAIACICDGSNGATASDGKKRYHCAVITGADIVDTTGAGDAFGTGATWALLQGMDLPKMLCAGTINATSVIGTMGAEAGLLTDIQMRQRLSDLQLDVREC
ncbi:carbohydrate kinase family protein [Candidatus Peribacteria bacterium]|nr:carbohydrate kinase family protein [Candidatus Peribacteria bacterium]